MIKVGVVGVGRLGQHHARNYAFENIKNSNLVAVCDVDEETTKKIAKKFKVDYFSDYKNFLGKVDAVSIVVPTHLHFEVAKFFLSHKIHCLVEKPITTTLQEAQELIDIAYKNDLILQVGHIERFNPAIIEIQKFIKNPKYIDVNRLGTYSQRVSNISVVLDLMVHDLDMVLFLTNSEVEKVDAAGTKVISETEDIANVRIKFKNGCVANISASRVSMEKLRKIRLFQSESYISLNYEDQSFKIYTKNPKVEKIQDLSDIKIEKFKPKKNVEPLFLELTDFIYCIINHKNPKVDGKHGYNALKLALEVREKIKEFSDN
ncbi:MAG: Gfo/Idh/MocA family oxidoreductase [Elusimicrobiota bacterium]|jgi:predicted dehydrogenase|nr:Gfo/Idh/MocA family oxidoreductase [Elusimicrobiota bacterium]